MEGVRATEPMVLEEIECGPPQCEQQQDRGNQNTRMGSLTF